MAATAHGVSCTASTLGLWLDASIIVLSACRRPAGSCPAVKAIGVIAPACAAIVAHPLSWLAGFPMCPGSRKNVLDGSDMKFSRSRRGRKFTPSLNSPLRGVKTKPIPQNIFLVSLSLWKRCTQQLLRCILLCPLSAGNSSHTHSKARSVAAVQPLAAKARPACQHWQQ